MATYWEKMVHSKKHHNSSYSPEKHYSKKKLKKNSHHHHNPGPPSLPSPRHCAKLKVDRVLADEKFTCCADFGPCDIGYSVPAGSTIEGTIDVVALECKPVILKPRQPVTVSIVLAFQEEFTVTQPDGKTTPLEFLFHTVCTKTFCPIHKLELTKDLIRRIRCEVFDLEKVNSKITFICSDKVFNGHATIAEHLEVCIVLQLVIADQLLVKLCDSERAEDLPDEAGMIREQEAKPAAPQQTITVHASPIQD